MPFIRFIMICATLLGLTACATMRPAPPEVQLAGLEITDLSLSHANFLASLQLYNPNSMTLDIEGLAFTLFLNDTRIAQGKTAKAFSIPAEDFGVAALRLSSSYLNILQLSTGLQGRDQITFRITGNIDVGGFGFMNISVPIEQEGTLPLTGSLQQLAPGQGGAAGGTMGIPGGGLLLGR